MNIFKPTTLTWRQLASFKWGIFLIGIAIGAEWPALFSPYTLIVIIIGLILCVPSGVAWLKEH